MAEDYLKSAGVLVMDGGFSNELRKRVSFSVNDEPLWTAKALLVDPLAVVDTHLAYLEAGADIIETCTYQASVEGFIKHENFDPKKGESLMKEAVRLARNAVDKFLKSESSTNRRVPLVAGSVGPYGAYLCDRSEYTGSYMDVVSKAQLTSFHAPRLHCLIESGVDFLLLETMPSVKEVEVLLEWLLKEYPSVHTMVSFSVREIQEGDQKYVRTAYGDDLRQIHKLVVRYPQVVGFGVNCCSPRIVQKFLEDSAAIIKSDGLELGNYKRIVYPNGGEDQFHKDENPELEKVSEETKPGLSIDSLLDAWILAGAQIIGGCCELGIKEIRKIRERVDQQAVQ